MLLGDTSAHACRAKVKGGWRGKSKRRRKRRDLQFLLCMHYMYALYLCLTCMSYMYVLCVCLICMPYMYALYVCLISMLDIRGERRDLQQEGRRQKTGALCRICMPYMYALYVCLICMPAAKRTAAEDWCTMLWASTGALPCITSSTLPCLPLPFAVRV